MIDFERINDNRIILTINSISFDFQVDGEGVIIDRYAITGDADLVTIHSEDF